MSATESSASLLGEQGELVDHFAALGVVAFTTGRDVGSFGMQSDDPVGEGDFTKGGRGGRGGR